MNHQGKVRLTRQANELRKNSALNFPWRMVVIVIQAGFTYGDDLRVSGEFL